MTAAHAPNVPPVPGVLAAELTWTGERFAPDVLVEVGTDGRIVRVLRGERPPAGRAVTRLPRRALLPGFVDAHSHAFQRGLRGRGESFPAGAGSFWTWREEMYALVEGLDAAALHDLSLRAFREMRAAGITAVGEFHYLHHENPERADFRFDEVVLAAAAAAPIRIVLLQAYYETGGPGQPLAGGQRRFACASPQQYWRQMDHLAGRLGADGTQTLGAVAHSLRAAPPETVAALHREARRRGLVFHLHLEEQRREIEEIEAAYGRRPMALLLDELAVGPELTAVHCTHTSAADLARFAATGANACLCPLTEANLGDGLPALDAAPGLHLCLGTDSNARISMAEEARWLEYGQRLAGERRGALRDANGRVAPVLMAAATRGGARALGLPAGDLVPGHWADFALLDLDHPSLARADAGTLAAAFLFGAGNAAVTASAVAGRWDAPPA
ncbi:MAG TPA: formimidoylglutamate deiminase [Thermoanaerobaculia bacterium]|nr:formimidoylglutamate deiminase [Thermoanaerobaculia bacterium]